MPAPRPGDHRTDLGSNAVGAQTRFNPRGGVVYSTCLGGPFTRTGRGVAVDPWGRASARKNRRPGSFSSVFFLPDV